MFAASMSSQGGELAPQGLQQQGEDSGTVQEAASQLQGQTTFRDRDMYDSSDTSQSHLTTPAREHGDVDHSPGKRRRGRRVHASVMQPPGMSVPLAGWRAEKHTRMSPEALKIYDKLVGCLTKDGKKRFAQVSSDGPQGINKLPAIQSPRMCRDLLGILFLKSRIEC